MTDPYWYIDYEAYEKKQNRENRVVIGLRYWSLEKTKTDFLYVNHKTPISTEFIHLSQDKLQKVLELWSSNELLSECRLKLFISNKIKDEVREKIKKEYKNLEIELNYGDYSVFQLFAPNYSKILKMLPNFFQKGNYDKLLRFEYPLLYRKIKFDNNLEKCLELKEEINNLKKDIKDIISKLAETKHMRTLIYNQLNAFAQKKPYFTLDDILTEEINKKYSAFKKIAQTEQGIQVIEKRNKISEFLDVIQQKLSEIDLKNKIEYNKESDDFEITLSSINLLGELGPRISVEEILSQVWQYRDIEKPLWKKRWIKNGIKIREQFLKAKNGDINKKRIWKVINEIKKMSPEDYNIIKDEAEFLLDLYNDNLDSSLLDKNLCSLEEKLTFIVDEIRAPLYEEKYDAKISWDMSITKLQDGSIIKKLNTIHETGLSIINDTPIIKYDSEDVLVVSAIKDMKESKIAFFANHNLPYDVIQIRSASERKKREKENEPFDLFIKNVFPARDVVKKVYQRMRKSIEFIDTYRIAVIFHGYLRSNNPKGDHKLETFANHILGKDAFKKNMNYDEMRVLEIKAINKDIQAARLIADYATRDVPPVKEIIERGHYIRTAVKIRDMFPFLTLTEILFSPKCMKKCFDYYCWINSHNQRNFSKSKRKIEEDESQIFKKRFPSIKRDRLRKEKIIPKNEPGVYEKVTQVYLPLELWLKDVLIKVEPKWKEYFESLSNDPITRYGELQYPNAYLKELLSDYYFTRNEMVRYTNKHREVGVTKGQLEQWLKEFADIIKNSNENYLLDSYYGSLEKLKNQYRSIYLASDAELRSRIRHHRLKKKGKDLAFTFVNFFAEDNEDIVLTKDIAELVSSPVETLNNMDIEIYNKIQSSINEKKKKELRRFLSNFNTICDLEKKLEKYANFIKERTDLVTPQNLVYIYIQRMRAAKRRKLFYYKYGILPDLEDTMDCMLNKKECDVIEYKNTFVPMNIKAMIDISYTNLKKELLEKKMQVLLIKGDYMYLVGEYSFQDSMMIPIRVIDNFVLSSKKKDTSQKNIFDDEFNDYDEILKKVVYDE